MNIAIGTCIFGDYQRYKLGTSSMRLLKNKFEVQGHKIGLYNITFEDDIVEIEGFTKLTSLNRDNRSINKNSTSRMPFVNDLFNNLADLDGYDYFIFCNADIILTERLIEYVLSTRYQNYVVSRLEIEEIKDIHCDIAVSKKEPKFEIYGFDVFISTPDWWNANSHRFPDYIYGKVAWDVHLCIMLCMYGDADVLNYFPPMVYHVFHKQSSDNLDAEYIYNVNYLWNKYPIYKAAWSTFFDDIVAKRGIGEDQIYYSKRLGNEELRKKLIFKVSKEIDEGKHPNLINENSVSKIKKYIKSEVRQLMKTNS